jgi:hypothetical protein
MTALELYKSIIIAGVAECCCIACDDWKPVTDFGRDSAQITGLRTECKQCYTPYRTRKARKFKITIIHIKELEKEQ